MFAALKAEVTSRFAAAESFFKASKALKGEPAQAAKGLAFVQMYAAYQYTVETLLQRAIDAIVAHKHPTKDLVPSLLTLFLDPELSSFRECGDKKEWEARFTLIERVFDKAPASIANTVFPNDGNYFKSPQLKLIFRVLGIKRCPTRRHRHLHRIDEVADNRNKVSHGRETAEAVGRNYARTDVSHAMNQMKGVCLFLISTIEVYCADTAKHCRK